MSFIIIVSFVLLILYYILLFIYRWFWLICKKKEILVLYKDWIEKLNKVIQIWDW